MTSVQKRRGNNESTSADTDTSGLDAPVGECLIVGGGPAGALAAKALAERNYSVTLCESYPRPTGSDEKKHAYVISVNSRGVRALRRVGVDPITDLKGAGALENRTFVRHGAKAGAKARVISKEDPNVVVRRQGLTASLLDLAEQSGTNVVFGKKLNDIDFDKREATFVDAKTGKETKRSYDLLIGADGIRSVTRTLLENKGLIGPVRKEEDDMEYQVAVLPRAWKELIDAAHAEKVPASASEISVHTWADRKSNSSSLVYPIDGGKKSLVAVICPGGTLDALKKGKKHGAFLEALYPNWKKEAREELASQLAEEDNVPTSGGTCIWTPTLAVPDHGVLLLGDSGHGMWPALGQGCNAALESVSVLADAVEAICGTGTVIPSAGAGVRAVDAWAVSSRERARLIAEEYQGLRHEDALAAVDLTFGGIGGRRVRGRQNSKGMFLAQTALMMILHKLTMKVVPTPALLRVMQGDDVSYSALQWQNKCEKVATYAALAAMAGGIISKLVL